MLRCEGNKVLMPEWAKVLAAKKRHIVLWGGRAGGKSVAAGAYVLSEARNRPINVLCARETQDSMSSSVQPMLKEMIEDLGWGNRFRVNRSTIEGVNGSKFLFHGLSESHGTARRIKSLHGIDICWVEEGQDISEESLQTLVPTIRRPGSRIIWTMNPRTVDDPVWQRFVQRRDPHALVRRVLYSDNPWLPEEMEMERRTLEEMKPGPYYENVWRGVPLSEAEGALWSRAMLERARMTEAEYAEEGDPDDLVVSIDPAGSRGDKSDFTGITVVARRNDHGYVLYSKRLKATPAEWSRAAIELYHRYGANALVIEAVGAGKSALLTVPSLFDPSLVIQEAKAVGSKWERASPIASLYEQGKMHHVGDHRDLEAEQLSFTIQSKRDDLVDSMVYAARDLRLAEASRSIEVAVF